MEDLRRGSVACSTELQPADLSEDQKTCVLLLSSRTELVFMHHVLSSSDA